MDEQRSSRPRGSVHLAGAVVCPSDEDSHTFSVNSAGGELYRLRAADARQRQHWVDRLRSVIEMFVNSRVCIVQRVYPTRDDSQQVKLFTEDRPIRVTNLVKWEMDATNPW